MYNETQNSKEKRMRELCSKLKGFALAASDRDHFKDYSLTLDRLEILLQNMLSDNKKTQKEYAKELKDKTATLKELRAEVEAVKREKEQDHLQLQSSIIVLKTHCSDSKKKLEVFKDSCVHSNVENLKEQNMRLGREVEKNVYLIEKLNTEKAQMVPASMFKALEEECNDRETALQKMGNWERKYWSLKTRSDQFELEVAQLKTQFDTQSSVQQPHRQDKDADAQISRVFSQIYDEDQLSNRSKETCEGMDLQFQTQKVDCQRPRKKRRANRKGRKGQTPPDTPTIQQDLNESTDVEVSEAPLIEPRIRTGQVQSFGVVMFCMFVLTGLLDMSR